MCKSSLGGLVRTLMLDLTLIFWLPFLGERFSVLDQCVSITFVEAGYNANIGNNCKFLLLVRLFKSRDSIQFATRNTKIHSCTETAFMVCVLGCKQMLTLQTTCFSQKFTYIYHLHECHSSLGVLLNSLSCSFSRVYSLDLWWLQKKQELGANV